MSGRGVSGIGDATGGGIGVGAFVEDGRRGLICKKGVGALLCRDAPCVGESICEGFFLSGVVMGLRISWTMGSSLTELNPPSSARCVVIASVVQAVGSSSCSVLNRDWATKTCLSLITHTPFLRKSLRRFRMSAGIQLLKISVVNPVKSSWNTSQRSLSLRSVVLYSTVL